MSEMDDVEKSILLRAPRSRVWRALTNAEEFGTWFRVTLEGSFTPGLQVTGRLADPGYKHVTFDVTVERMDAEELFSFRWHPYAIDPKIDYSTEPTTLVEFRLKEVADGTRLTVTESGFDRIPPDRRDEAQRMHTQGWATQMENVQRHVAGERRSPPVSPPGPAR